MKPRARKCLSWLALFVALGCTRPAEDRTRRDLDVGHAQNASLDVRSGCGPRRRALALE